MLIAEPPTPRGKAPCKSVCFRRRAKRMDDLPPSAAPALQRALRPIPNTPYLAIYDPHPPPTPYTPRPMRHEPPHIPCSVRCHIRPCTPHIICPRTFASRRAICIPPCTPGTVHCCIRFCTPLHLIPALPSASRPAACAKLRNKIPRTLSVLKIPCKSCAVPCINAAKPGQTTEKSDF